MKVRFKLGFAVAIASGLLAATISPAAAFAFKGAGLYGFFATQGVSGLAVIDRVNTGDPRLTVALVHFPPSEEIALRFRSIGCGGTPAGANRILALAHNSDSHGDLFFDIPLADSIGFGAIRSLWHTSTDGTDCVETVDFTKINTSTAGGYDADAALSLVKIGAGTMALFVHPESSTSAELDIVVKGMAESDVFRARAVNKPCAKAPTQTLFSYQVQNVEGGSAIFQEHISLNQAGLDAMRSIRVNDLGGDDRWCAPMSLIVNEALT